MVAPAVLAIPIIMAGARVIIRKLPEIAKRLIQQGKAKHPDKVIKDLEQAIKTKTVPGRTAVIKPGGRSVVSGSTKEANKLIKIGQAQKAKTVLNSLKRAWEKARTAPKSVPKAGKPGQQPYEDLVKQGKLPKATGGQVKKAGGGTLKTSKQIMTIRSPRPTIKKPWGAAVKGRGKGYKS